MEESLFYLFATLYSIAGTTATLKPYYSKFKTKMTGLSVHESILFECYKKAVKDVTGKDIKKYKLKGEIELFERAMKYFEHNSFSSSESKIREYILGDNETLKKVEDKFIEYLKQDSTP
ncbi:MAG: hypothetical protein GY932_14035, partial [Arcobacter sp.]|nr:hypothetical protein [Arcobacter sp.]